MTAVGVLPRQVQRRMQVWIGDRTACLGHQDFQCLKFQRSQMNRAPRLFDKIADGIERDVAYGNSRVLGSVWGLKAPNGGPDSSDKLLKLKRLGNIVIRSSIKRLHLVPFVAANR